MKLSRAIVVGVCVAAIGCGVASVRSARAASGNSGTLAATQRDSADSEPRMWLELEPDRFKAQATVVELLWLDGLNKQLSLSQPSGTARRSVLFSQADTAWRHAMQMGAPRPAAFKTPELAELDDLGGQARLFWRAADVTQPATLLEMIGDLEQIWGAGMQAAISDYAAAFEMLGRFHGATAEIREGQGRLMARLVLVAASESAAKRASGALALASALGKLVAGGAVRSGQMTAAAAAALDSVLGSIETRVDGARLTVQLGIDVTTLREALQ
jgi:hypothetical protein